MNVRTASPSSPNPNTLFFTPFLSTTAYLRRSSIHLRRRTHKISYIRCTSDQFSTSVIRRDLIREKRKPNSEKRKLNAVQSAVDALSPPVRISSSVLIIATAIAGSYALGSQFGWSRNAAIGGAVAVGAAAWGTYALNSCVPEVAAARLHNYVVESGGPAAIKKEDVDAIAKRYGVSKQNEAFKAELCEIYSEFLNAVFPPGVEDLKGDEAETLIKFKNSLGIDDPDAAAMHIETARRIIRERLETGDCDANMEHRRAFQKLVYISNLVFGEASGFLLPWKRVFKFNDSQVEVAVRDNAQRLYASKLASISQDVDASQVIILREAQLRYQLSDQLAEDMFREHTRKLVEQSISAALTVLKSRTKVVKPVIMELDKILAFNSKLLSLKSQSDASRFSRGISGVSLMGGEYDVDRKMDDLKLLYKAYVKDAFSGGCIEEEKFAALSELRNIFGLGRREAESVVIEVTSQFYRRSLQMAVSSGDLMKADSKASYLQNLCAKLHFDAGKAIEIHEDIYRRKLQLLVADKGELSDEDVKTLEQIQFLFCIPKQTIESAHGDICGGVFEKVIKNAIASGVDGYDSETKKAVRKAAFGLRLSREVAMSIASKAVRGIFINYIERARAAGSRTASAKELKKMIAFNSLVVTDLVADIKGESADRPPTDEPTTKEEPQTEDDEEWISLQSLRKARPSKDSTGKPSQKEINLRDDLPVRDRTDLYETFLLCVVRGEATMLPFDLEIGTEIGTKKGDSEFVLLNQLGGILGLTDTEIVEVHRSLAEQDFRQKAEVIFADGQFTKSRIEQLNVLQKESGLPPQYAEKIINNIATSKLSAALETAAGRGSLGLKEIRELKANGVDVDNMITGSLRENIFKQTIDDIFSSGTGEFDGEEVYEKIPNDLSINAEKAKQIVHELARTRLSNSLIQAVSLLRQRDHQGVVKSLNDLLACDKSVRSTPLSWDLPEELADLFLVYLKSNQASENVIRVQYLLNISGSTAETLRAVKDEGLPNEAAEQEEFEF